MVDHTEVFQIVTFRKLILSFPIYVVHQNVFIGTDAFEYAGTFHGIGGLLFIIVVLRPLSGGERPGGGQLYSVAVPFGFIKHIEQPVLEDDIAVDTRLSILRKEQRLRLAFQAGKLLIGISVINDIGAIAMFHRPVYHVFAGFRIEDGLRRPHPFEVFLAGIFLLDVDDAGSPMNQVGRLEQDHRTVRVPPLGGGHVGKDHVKRPAVLVSQNMRISYSAGRADFL